MGKEEDSVVNYSLPTHKSLMQKWTFLGIGQTAFLVIVMVSIILASMLSIYCILLGVVAFFVCRALCKNEPQRMEFIFQNLGQQDIYLG